MNKPLPKVRQVREVKHFLLNIPPPVWDRMLEDAGLAWGQATPFIIQAITEKLDRMQEKEADND